MFSMLTSQSQFCKDLDDGSIAKGPWEMNLSRLRVTQTAQYINSLAAPGLEDVLVSDRLHAPHLYEQSRWLDYHRGNKRLSKAALRHHRLWLRYLGLPKDFQTAVCWSVLEKALSASDQATGDAGFQRRHQILRQNKFGNWVALSDEDSLRWTQEYIVKLLSRPYTVVPNGGAFWKGPCANRDGMSICRVLVSKPFLLSPSPMPPSFLPGTTINDERAEAKANMKKEAASSLLVSLLPRSFLPDVGKIATTAIFLAAAEGSTQPSPASKNDDTSIAFEIGDRVDGRWKGKTRRWWKGAVINRHSDGTYDVNYDNNNEDRRLARKFIRPSREFTDLASAKNVYGIRRHWK